MYTLDTYLTPAEARAERAYLEAYRAEYERLYKAEWAGDRERLVYWSEVAHRVGRSARERVLADQQPAAVLATAMLEWLRSGARP